jgi:hypothetical protein
LDFLLTLQASILSPWARSVVSQKIFSAACWPLEAHGVWIRAPGFQFAFLHLRVLAWCSLCLRLIILIVQEYHAWVSLDFRSGAKAFIALLADLSPVSLATISDSRQIHFPAAVFSVPSFRGCWITPRFPGPRAPGHALYSLFVFLLPGRIALLSFSVHVPFDSHAWISPPPAEVLGLWLAASARSRLLISRWSRLGPPLVGSPKTSWIALSLVEFATCSVGLSLCLPLHKAKLVVSFDLFVSVFHGAATDPAAAVPQTGPGFNCHCWVS